MLHSQFGHKLTTNQKYQFSMEPDRLQMKSDELVIDTLQNSMDVEEEEQIIKEEALEDSMTNSMAVFSELNDDDQSCFSIQRPEPIGTQAIIQAT
jgi:hypothetical protein